jgi:hypothetical protein
MPFDNDSAKLLQEKFARILKANLFIHAPRGPAQGKCVKRDA